MFSPLLLSPLCVASALALISCSLADSHGLPPQELPSYAGFSGERRIAVTGHAGDAMEPFIAADGETLFFNNSNDPAVDTNIFSAVRYADNQFAAQGELAGAGSPALDGVPSVDASARFFFISLREYDQTRGSVFVGDMAERGITNVRLVTGLVTERRGQIVFDAEISRDGQTLLFAEGQFSGSPVPQSAVIMFARRRGEHFSRDADSVRIMASVNERGLNYAPSISADGLELFFTRFMAGEADATPRIMRATRTAPDQPFAQPQRVSGPSGFVEAPSLAADGRTLYYHRRDNAGYSIYAVSR